MCNLLKHCLWVENTKNELENICLSQINLTIILIFRFQECIIVINLDISEVYLKNIK